MGKPAKVVTVLAISVLALFSLLVVLFSLLASRRDEDPMGSNTNGNVIVQTNVSATPIATSATPSASPSQLPSPSATRQPQASPNPSPVGPDWTATILDEERKLRESKIAFNPPAEMQEQKTETMQARISFEDIGGRLAQGLQGPGTAQEAPLKVSEIMKVTLTGDGNAFLIQGIGEEEQVVAGKEYAQWEWHVTPLRPGDQKLTLTATATIFLPGRGEKPIHHKTLEKLIIVRVDRWYSLQQFIANNWQWLWAVVVVPAGGLLWKLRKRKSENP